MTNPRPRYVVKWQHKYISKRGTSNPKTVDTIDQARIYLRAGDAWQMARRWDKYYAHYQPQPFPLKAVVVEVFITEGQILQDLKFKDKK